MDIEFQEIWRKASKSKWTLYFHSMILFYSNKIFLGKQIISKKKCFYYRLQWNKTDKIFQESSMAISKLKWWKREPLPSETVWSSICPQSCSDGTLSSGFCQHKYSECQLSWGIRHMHIGAINKGFYSEFLHERFFMKVGPDYPSRSLSTCAVCWFCGKKSYESFLICEIIREEKLNLIFFWEIYGS